ncbi:MAG: tetratricopeptide repeat protein [Vicinamibacterales bacterium]
MDQQRSELAQVTPRLLLAAFALWMCVGGAAWAQTNVPEAGLAAESAGRWDDAIRVYRQVLAVEPGRADLWVRVADIAARLERAADVTDALSRAVEVSPDDPALHLRLSQAHAAANDPAAAQHAVDRALTLRPLDPEYVRAGAVLATWNGDYSSAARRYRQLQVLQPSDTTIALHLARVSAWSGETAEAVDAYRRYLRAHPDASDAWLDLATAESWRGNYASALDALDEYRNRFGESRAYSLVLARVLAGAGRPTRAVDVLEPLWQQDPGSYEVNLARAIAFTMQRSIADTHDALASVRRLDPTSRETRNAERLARAMIGSSIEPGFTFYSDSDHLQVARIAPSGSLMLASGTRLSAGYARYFLRAAPDSGLDRIAGGTAIHEQTWGELAQAFGGLTLSGRVGSATADARRRPQHAIGAQWRASDEFTIGVEQSHGFVVISPRTVELGLTEQRFRGDLLWTPTLMTTVAAEATHQEFSDGNRRWELRVAPRRAFVRTESMNLDFGLSAYRLETSHDLANGYYDPRKYEAYQATAYPYFKVSEDVGLGLSLAAGTQREGQRPFHFGGGATAEATLGIYQPWVLRITGSATHNLRQESGAFRGYAGSVVLMRRF